MTTFDPGFRSFRGLRARLLAPSDRWPNDAPCQDLVRTFCYKTSGEWEPVSLARAALSARAPVSSYLARTKEMNMKYSKSSRVVWLLTAAALLASCSGIRALQQQDAAEHARFNAYAGKPVRQFTWITANRSTQPIWTNQLVAWSDVNQAYLITVAQPCPNLMVANHVSVSSTAGTVFARADRVFARGRTCVIETIQPVDYRRMQRDLQRQ